jgi:uncharacterized repeat protein (TIGR03803 family)
LEFSRNGLDKRGARPNGELASDGRGFFWGTTFQGGITQRGTVFKINQATGELTTIREFGFGPEGYGPYAALSPDDDTSYFWGTVNRGGPYDSGSIFKIDITTGEFTLIQQLSGIGGPAPGTEPRARLFNDGRGGFWGITSEGGLPGGPRGLGTVFRIDALTKQFANVIRFTGTGGANRGSEPRPQLIADDSGNLIGTTWKGGANDHGTVFKVNPNTGELTTLLEFTGLGAQPNNGSLPGYGSLLRHTDGNIYGTTQEGGPEGGGTIFRLRYGPTPVTLAATSIRVARATLMGTINPNGNETAVQFELSTSPSLEAATVVNAGSSTDGTTPEPFQQEVSGLASATTYYYRIVGTNEANAIPQRGMIRSFTTNASALPVVTLLGENPLTWEASASYADPGATATDVEDGMLVPVKTADNVVAAVPGTYAVTWSATDSDEITGSATRTINVVDTTKPMLIVSADIAAVAQEPIGQIVTYEPAVATDFVGVTQVIYSHPSGSVFPMGVTQVTVTARDAAGNETVGTFNVRVTLAESVHQVVALEGGAVPGAGVDPRIPAGAVWASFGGPAISASGKIAFTARWVGRSGSAGGKGLFIDGALAAAVGDASPLAGTTIRQISTPTFGQDSDAVLISATVAGSGNSATEKEVLLAFTPTATLLCSVGQDAGIGGGITIKKLVGASLSSERGLILARLTGGNPEVNSKNNLALFSTGPEGLVALARTGQTILGKTVAGLGILKPVAGSPAQGRGEDTAAGVRFIARFTDRWPGAPPRQRIKTQAIVESSEPGSFVARAVTGDITGEPGVPPTWTTFGAALSNSADGETFAFRAGTLVPFGELSPPSDNIYLGSVGGFTWITGVGRPLPDKIPGVFAAFGEPVLSSDGTLLAFVARIWGTRKVRSTGVFALRGDAPLTTVATLESTVPGAPVSAHWKSFVSVAAVGGGVGPIFHATLELGGAITESNDSGLWAVDAAGVLRSVVREGDDLGGRQVKVIQALNAASGIQGSTRSFNAAQQLVWKGSFTDQTSAIVLTTVP